MTLTYVLLGLAFVAVFLLGYNLRAHNEEDRKMYITRKNAYRKVLRNSKINKQDTNTLDRIEKTRQQLSDALDEYERNYNKLF